MIYAWVCGGYYSHNFHYTILAYQLTSTEKRDFSTNPYYKILDRSRVSRSSEFLHMNWGWENWQNNDDYVDPATLSGNSIGWFRSVFNADIGYTSDLRILQIIK